MNVIIGLGESGYSCVAYLAAKGEPICVVDSRPNPPNLEALKKNYPHIPVYVGSFPKAILAKATQVILSPGIPKDHPEIIEAIPSNTEILGDIELFAREAKAPVIAITGSNGKSTVTTLVGEMAKAAGIRVGVGGNLGIPALSLLAENPELFVLELSSFQLETTNSLKPKAATILNICPDHLDRYPTVEAYQKAKQRIYQHCEYAIVNREDNQSAKGIMPGTKILSFGLDKPESPHYGLINYQNEIWLAKGQEPLYLSKKLKLFGRHNMANALAALALGEAAGFPRMAMVSALENFSGLPHRCEWVRTLNEVQWINDSKGTNVGATLSALNGLSSSIPGKWVLIAGGLGKNADFSPLREPIEKYCRAVILIGEATEELYTLLSPVVSCLKVFNMQEAVHLASKTAKPGDGVLLSPACASYDMFQNFEHRGEVFKTQVLNIE